MALHAVPLILGGSLVGLLALTFAQRTPQATKPPEKDVPIVPPPPPKPNVFPSGTQTGIVVATHGVNVRDQPDERGSRVLAAVSKGERVAILDGGAMSPATPAAPQGWLHVQTLGGVTGWATAEFIFLGTDQEAQAAGWLGDLVPTFSGVSFGGCCGSCEAGGPCISGCPNFGAVRRYGPHYGRSRRWTARELAELRAQHRIPRFGQAPPGALGGAATVRPNRFPALTRAVADMRSRGGHRTDRVPHERFRRPGAVAWFVEEPVAIVLGALRCVAPSGCYLRDAAGRSTGVVVENGGLVQALQRTLGPKTDPASPSPGGWTLARVTDSMTGAVVDGWLPSEWLVSA